MAIRKKKSRKFFSFFKKHKLFVLSIVIILLLILGFFISFLKITSFVVKEPVEPFEVRLPEINEGSETEYLGYKYSNNSRVIVSAPSEISCSWKSAEIDDGWKVCEAIFEIEDQGASKKILSAPRVELVFSKSKNIKNIDVSYSNEFVLGKREYLETALEEVNKTIVKHKKLEENNLAIAGEGVGKEMPLPEVETVKKILRAEKKELKKREFSDFSGGILVVEPFTDITVPAFGNESLSEASSGNFKNNLEATEESIKQLKENLEATEESIKQLKKILEEQFGSEEASNQSEASGENNKTPAFSKKNKGGGNDYQVSILFEENNNLSGGIVVLDNETLANNTFDSNETQNQSQEDDEDNEDKNKTNEDKGNEDKNKTNEDKGNEDKNKTNEDKGNEDKDKGKGNKGVNGFVVSSEEEILLNTSRPFAVKVKFEIPKYDSNQFNFRLTDESFEASLDPDVESCGTLDSENGVYTLEQNISSEGTCFIISANNVTLDCQGNTINYSAYGGEGYAVYSTGDYTLIKNCIISVEPGVNSGGGVLFMESHNSTLFNNTFFSYGDLVSQVYLDTSFNSLVLENTFNVYGNDSFGIYTTSDSISSEILHNNILTFGQRSPGIYCSSNSNFASVESNIINTSGDESHGIAMDSSSYLNVTKNIINIMGSGVYGIFCEVSSILKIEENNLSAFRRGGNGIYLSEVSDVEISYNNISIGGSLGDSFDNSGVFLFQTSGISLRDNFFFSSRDGTDVIYVGESSSYSNISGNSISLPSNYSQGIFFSPDSLRSSVLNNFINCSGEGSSGLVISYSDYNTVTNNSITTSGEGGHCAYFDVSSDSNSLIENHFSTFGPGAYGLYLSANTENNSFKFNRISTNDFGAYPIYIYEPDVNFTFESDIIESNTSAFLLNSNVNGGVWNITNVTANNVSWPSDSSGTLIINWYLDILANYTNGSFVPGVNITLFDVNGYEQFSELTNQEGAIERKVLIDYIQTSDDEKTYYSNYTFNATIGDQNIFGSVNGSSSSSLILTFTGYMEQVNDSEDVALPPGGGGGGGSFTINTSCSSANLCTEWSDCVNGEQERKCKNLKPDCKKQFLETKRKCTVNDSVPSKKKDGALFDINIAILNKNASVSGKLLSSVSLINLGSLGKVAVNLSYEVRNNQKEVVYMEKEIVPVETQIEFIKTIDVSNLPEGRYTLFASLVYEGQTEPAFSEVEFTIGEESLSQLGVRYAFFAALGLIGVVLIFFVVHIIRKFLISGKIRFFN